MEPSDRTLVRSLIAVAWVDGKVAEEETGLIDALIDAFGATEDEKAELRRFGSVKRTLDDVPLRELDGGMRRRLLQLAVLVSFVDGKQDDDELALLKDLATRLDILPNERDPLMKGSAARARALLHVLQA